MLYLGQSPCVYYTRLLRLAVQLLCLSWIWSAGCSAVCAPLSAAPAALSGLGENASEIDDERVGVAVGLCQPMSAGEAQLPAG
jgi:hypothetical protein